MLTARRFEEQIEELKFLNKTLTTQVETEIEQHEKERERVKTLVRKVEQETKRTHYFSLFT